MSLTKFYSDNPPAPAGVGSCIACRWFVPEVDHQGGTLGECRRRAPKSLVNPLTHVRHTIWPQVNSDQWCGAMEPAKA